MSSLANDSGDIDFNALAQLLIQSQSSQESARPRPTTTEKPKTTKATTRATTRAATRAATRKQLQRTNGKKKATVNAVKVLFELNIGLYLQDLFIHGYKQNVQPASKKPKQSARPAKKAATTALPKPTTAYNGPMESGFRVRSGDTSGNFEDIKLYE